MFNSFCMFQHMLHVQHFLHVSTLCFNTFCMFQHCHTFQHFLYVSTLSVCFNMFCMFQHFLYVSTLQCSKCIENFLGNPIDGHQCFRTMTVDFEYCLDPNTQSFCTSIPSTPAPLYPGRTVFYGVQPKYMNVDIRIVVDITVGGKLSLKSLTFPEILNFLQSKAITVFGFLSYLAS